MRNIVFTSSPAFVANHTFVFYQKPVQCTRFSLSMENEQADAGRGSRTRFTGPNKFAGASEDSHSDFFVMIRVVYSVTQNIQQFSSLLYSYKLSIPSAQRSRNINHLYTFCLLLESVQLTIYVNHISLLE